MSALHTQEHLATQLTEFYEDQHESSSDVYGKKGLFTVFGHTKDCKIGTHCLPVFLVGLGDLDQPMIPSAAANKSCTGTSTLAQHPEKLCGSVLSLLGVMLLKLSSQLNPTGFISNFKI